MFNISYEGITSPTSNSEMVSTVGLVRDMIYLKTQMEEKEKRLEALEETVDSLLEKEASRIRQCPPAPLHSTSQSQMKDHDVAKSTSYIIIKAPIRGLWGEMSCLSLCLYGIRAPKIDFFRA